MRNEMYKEMLDELVEAIFGMKEITDEVDEIEEVRKIRKLYLLELKKELSKKQDGLNNGAGGI